MTLKERVERLEKIVWSLCKSEIDSNLDVSYQEWADPLHEFIKDMKKEGLMEWWEEEK